MKCSFSYRVTKAEKATATCDASDAYCEVWDIKSDGGEKDVPDYVEAAARFLAEAIEMFKEEEKP